MKYCLSLCLLWGLLTGLAQATPRMSLPAGTPCITCHFSSTGGGPRTEVGYGSMAHTGLIKMTPFESNEAIEDRLFVGLNTRIQWAHFGIPVKEYNDAGDEVVTVPKPKAIPMQFQVNAGLNVVDGVTVAGSYNAGPETKNGKLCDNVFPGMSCFELSVQAQSENGFSVRGGMMQPHIGIRPDDHTTLLRGDAAYPRNPVIPPNYAEWGGELAYQPKSWFRTEVGAFHTENLDRSVNQGGWATSLWPAAYSARVTFLPRFSIGDGPTEKSADDDFDDDFGDDFDAPVAPPPMGLNTWIGASIFGSDEFYMVDGFLGAGLDNGLEARLGASLSERAMNYTTHAVSLSTTYRLANWFVPALRVERGVTDADTRAVTWQYVGGVEFFVAPGVEIRPEYRITKTNDYVFGQTTVQLHIFH
ncbi:MAG: hypothetical protein ACON3Z_09630 [Bradymonadia bacterium]